MFEYLKFLFMILKILLKFLFVIFLINSTFSFSQNIIPYKKGKWGFIDTTNNKIVVPAIYDEATEFRDSIGIVAYRNFDGDLKYGLVNIKREIPPKFIFDYIYFENTDNQSSDYKIAAFQLIKKNGDKAEKKFYINSNCNCVPQNYYSCPPKIKTDTSNSTRDIILIQKAEEALIYHDTLIALELCKEAINYNPSNPYPYYWGIKNFLNLDFFFSTKKNQILDTNIITWLEENIDLALTLEKDTSRIVTILDAKYKFNKYILKKENDLKLSEKERREMNICVEHNDPGIIIGYNRGRSNFFEIGYVKGIWMEKNKFINVNALIGFSLIKSTDGFQDGIKLQYLAFHSPIDIGLYPVLFTDYDIFSVGFMPEIGININKLCITYGYTFINRVDFDKIQGHNLNIRLIIPLRKRISYAYKLFSSQ